MKSNLNSFLTWIGIILQYIKDYGISNILKAFIIILLMQLFYNPTAIFDKYSEYMTQKHNAELEIGANDDRKVKELLPKLLYGSGASRVWIIQYHNGISDWQYGSMRFEMPLEGVYSIKEQYDNFHLSWLNFPDYLKVHKIFIGDLEAIKEIDLTLYNNFKKNNITFLSCILLSDNNGFPTGILGFTWDNNQTVIHDRNGIQTSLIRYGAIVEQYIKPNIINNSK